MKLPAGTKLPRGYSHEAVVEAIKAFMQANDDYGTPDGARYVCFEASAVFIGELDALVNKERSTVREMFFCNYDGRGRHICDEPRNRAAHQYDDYPLIEHVDQKDISNHVVAIVGNLCIDFTARQFKSDAPWPLMWVYKKPQLRGKSRQSTS